MNAPGAASGSHTPFTVSLRPARALLLDIEGTTTPVDFVTEVLFPFARRNMRPFLRRHRDEAAVRADLQVLKKEREEDARAGSAPPQWEDSRESEIASAEAYLLWLMDRDRKSTPLKSLQGRIWEEGYREGSLRGRLYPDVRPAFERWRRQGREVCLFSSGSVLAQRLLFAHSEEGDLTPLIRDYFDTTTGPKREAGSYSRIAAAMGLAGAEILFLSDTEEEVDAARAAGLQALHCARGNRRQSARVEQGRVSSFDPIFP